MAARQIDIHYHRPPNRDRVFHQRLVTEASDHLVTLLDAAPMPEPVVVAGRCVLEPGAPVVWFTYPGRWHDIGRFHLADGTFTGFYANILTPVQIRGDRWETTDLFLDVWIGTDGRVEILDQDEMDEAIRNGWLDADTACAAQAEAGRLADAAARGAWPPQHTSHWTLARARARLDGPETDRP